MQEKTAVDIAKQLRRMNETLDKIADAVKKNSQKKGLGEDCPYCDIPMIKETMFLIKKKDLENLYYCSKCDVTTDAKYWRHDQHARRPKAKCSICGDESRKLKALSVKEQT